MRHRGAVLCAALLAGGCGDDGLPPPGAWKYEVVRDEAFAHPSHALPVDGGVWVTDIFADALVELDALPPRRVDARAPPDTRLASPHFLAEATDGALLTAEGWGRDLVALYANEGRWRRFGGLDGGFSAPHGVCVSEDGWIYVADSLNSRLVRFRDLDGSGWGIFPDRERRVGYARQLLCLGDALYLANSYPDRPGINPGEGGNVLRIDDFDAGEAHVELEFPHAAVTGVWPLDGTHRLVSLWRDEAPLQLCRADRGTCEPVPAPDDSLGIPYGIHFDAAARSGVVAYIGSEGPDGGRRPGGLLRFSLDGGP